jgi:hypothetical protein
VLAERPVHEFDAAGKLNVDWAPEGVLTTGLAVGAGFTDVVALEKDGTGGSVDNCSR